MAGANGKKIIWAAQNFLPEKKFINLFGDGKTAEKIIKILLKQLNNVNKNHEK